ncbi:MAG: 4Fe-4S binding protein [Methanomassiliicoccales archaeon]|nr:4Fe-4S binding protein [Methanomassiliicoccales archaeon]
MTSVRFVGVEFKNPFIVASSPLTANIQLLQLAEKYGAAGASVKLTMRKPPFKGQLRAIVVPGLGMIHASERRLGLEEGLRLVAEAKEKTSLVLFANITSESGSLDEWVYLARRFAQAGADFIEANLCCPMIGLDQAHAGINQHNLRGGAVTGEHPELVFNVARAISSEVSVPLVCKLTPTVSNLAEVAQAAMEGGAIGLHVFGGPSLVLPPLDLDRGGIPLYPLLDGACYGFLAGPAIKFASYKRVAEVKSAVKAPVIGSGGIMTWRDAVEMMMWGADLISACAAIMINGFEVITHIVNGIERYMQEKQLSYSDIVGAALKFLKPTFQVQVVEGYAVVDEALCTGCGRCEKIGHCLAISVTNGVARVEKALCIGCGICRSLCPQGAIKLVEKA